MIVGRDVFSLFLYVLKLGKLDKDGRYFKSIECCKEYSLIILGIFIVVYIVKERNRKNLIKCLKINLVVCEMR